MAERPEGPGAGDEDQERDDDEEQETPAEPPESPFTTETIKFMVGDELLAIALDNGPVGERSVPVGVAGPFLYRFHEWAHSIAASIALEGRRLGSRGPLPPVPSVGLFGLLGVAYTNSVTFHLGLGASEQTAIADDGQITSLTQIVLERMRALIEAAAAGDPDGLWKEARSLEARVGDNYERLLDVLVTSGIDSRWQFPERPGAASITSTRAAYAKELLEYEAIPVIDEEIRRGYLYQVNAREHKFNLEPEDMAEGEEKEARVITGTYQSDLRDELKEAWDERVEVRLRTRKKYLRRQIEPDEIEYELLEIIEILES
jgi:hypothetical protein